MNNLIIKYKNKRLYTNLILGLVWILLGVIGLWESDNIKWSKFLTIIIGFLYLGMSIWEFKHQYLTITDKLIKENALFGKKILINDIIYKRKFAGDYTLKTANKSFSINTNFVHPDSIAKLDSFIDSIALPEDKKGNQ